MAQQRGAQRPDGAGRASEGLDLLAATEPAYREDEALRVEDVMHVLHLSRNTVYKLARTGELPSFRVGRQLRFRYGDVLRRLGTSEPSGPDAGADPHPAQAAGREPLAPVGVRGDVLDELPAWARGSIVIGGQDLAGDILSNYLSGFGIRTLRSHDNAYFSLSRMYAGTCHAAVVNLWSEAEHTYNAPYLRSFLPGMPAIAFRLYRHRVGFTVAQGNPLGIAGWDDLLRPEVSIVNRPRGDGARVLLDEKLKYLEAVASRVRGYERVVASDLAQALVVSRGLADAAVTGQKPARQVPGVEFVPLQDEVVDLCVAKTPATEPLVRALRSLLRTRAFRGEFDEELVDVSLMGEVVYES